MFAPVLNGIAPALIEQGYHSASESSLQGSQALARGISSAGQSVASGIGSALEAMQQKAALQSANAARAQAWADSGFIDKSPKVASIFAQAAAEKDPYKQSGLLSVGDALVHMESEKQRVQNLMDQSRKLAEDKATISANAPGKVLRTGNGYFQQINGTWQPAVDAQGNPLTVPVGSAGSLVAAMDALGAKADQADLARLQGEIAAGNVKPGPDWLPGNIFGANYKDQLTQKAASMAAGGAGVLAGGAQGAGPGAVQAWQNPDQVAAAVQSGQLTREAARQILQSQFGFR